MQRTSDVVDRRTLAGELLLYCHPHSLEEILVPILLFQLFLKLRSEHSQEFGIARDERCLGVGHAKYDRIVRGPADHGATEVALNGFYLGPRLYKLNPKWRKAGTCAVAGDRQYPRKGTLDQYRRLDLIRQEPAELDAPLCILFFLQDFFRAGELLITSHLVYG